MELWETLLRRWLILDREQMRRIANNMPEQHDDKPQAEYAAKVINNVFISLWQRSRYHS